MIAIPSEAAKKRASCSRIKPELEKLGYDRVEVDQLGNVIGWMGTGDKIIAIDSHIDTVGIGNRTNWTHDPIRAMRRTTGHLRPRRLRPGGRHGLRHLRREDHEGSGLIPEGYKIMVVGSVQEEDCDGMCWQSIVNEYLQRRRMPAADASSSSPPSPTDGGIYRGHRGRMEIRVDMHGVSCHGSARSAATTPSTRWPRSC